VGVVGDVRHAALESEPRAMTYWPHARFPYGTMTLAIRTRSESMAIVNPVVSAVRAQDPALAVSDIRTMAQVVSDSVAERRLTMLMLTIFAGAALLLAAVGIYGVIAYSVTERTQEIGIRMALGARRGDVLRMIVGQALALTLLGVVLGGISALLLARLMTGLLYNVRPADPATFVAVAAALTLVAAAASYVPGRRATRVDPVIALRAE
jgi:putative ABC transport system permease protein